MSTVTRQDDEWVDIWKDILSGGAPRWKNDEIFEFDTKHLELLREHLSSSSSSSSPSSILVPMCGDCLFIKTSIQNGFKVVGIEYSHDAVQKLIERVADVEGADRFLATKNTQQSLVVHVMFD